MTGLGIQTDGRNDNLENELGLTGIRGFDFAQDELKKNNLTGILFGGALRTLLEDTNYPIWNKHKLGLTDVHKDLDILVLGKTKDITSLTTSIKQRKANDTIYEDIDWRWPTIYLGHPVFENNTGLHLAWTFPQESPIRGELQPGLIIPDSIFLSNSSTHIKKAGEQLFHTLNEKQKKISTLLYTALSDQPSFTIHKHQYSRTLITKDGEHIPLGSLKLIGKGEHS